MTRYLLDTTALIDFSKGREPARSQIPSMIDAGDDLGVCGVNIAEFYSGLSATQRALWDEFVNALHYWGISAQAAKQAGIWRYDFARRGVTLSTTDSLIAGVAFEVQAIVVTNNVKDYPMEELPVLPLTN